MIMHNRIGASLGLMVWVLGSLANGAELSPSSPIDAGSPARIDALVRQLGDSTFQRREEASKELTRIGLPARPALQQARNDADAEIRDRVRRILVVVDRAHLEQQIAAFLADTDGQHEHDLPGWKRFRELVGSDHDAHRFFAGMLRAETDLIAAVDGEPKLLQRQLVKRLQEFQQLVQSPRGGRRNQAIPLESMAAMLFVGSDPNVSISDNMSAVIFGQMHQSPLLAAIERNSSKGAERSLLRRWILRGTDGLAIQYGLSLSLQYNLREEGVELAEKALANAGATNPPPQAALMLLSRFGSARHVTLLEPLLDNKIVLWTNKQKQQELSGQVRDLALAVMVNLTEQEHADYGFRSVQKKQKPKDSVNTLGFANDTDREAAIGKWRAWKAAHAAE